MMESGRRLRVAGSSATRPPGDVLPANDMLTASLALALTAAVSAVTRHHHHHPTDRATNRRLSGIQQAVYTGTGSSAAS